jgi:hypothetical protein
VCGDTASWEIVPRASHATGFQFSVLGDWMPDSGLFERFDRSSPILDGGTTLPAHLLDDVARALKEAVDQTARSLDMANAIPVTLEHRPLHQANDADHADHADPDVELPQILQGASRSIVAPAPPAKSEPVRNQILAPVIFVTSLVAVALLMSASIVDLSRLTGFDWLSDRPRPRLIALAAPAISVAAALDAGVPAELAIAADPPLLTIAEQTLLERCEGLIAKGDMAGARQELLRAADDGSVSARFALAETFDPNVLAAWGLRERVADVGAARSLYVEAMSAGDPRAAGRIEALRADVN